MLSILRKSALLFWRKNRKFQPHNCCSLIAELIDSINFTDQVVERCREEENIGEDSDNMNSNKNNYTSTKKEHHKMTAHLNRQAVDRCSAQSVHLCGVCFALSWRWSVQFDTQTQDYGHLLPACRRLGRSRLIIHSWLTSSFRHD